MINQIFHLVNLNLKVACWIIYFNNLTIKLNNEWCGNNSDNIFGVKNAFRLWCNSVKALITAGDLTHEI